MKRIVLMVVLVFVIATSLALTASLAFAQGPERCGPQERPVYEQAPGGPPELKACLFRGGSGGN